MGPTLHRAITEAFVKRQRGRRELVGCSNWDQLMEPTLRVICACIEENLDHGFPFFFGQVPSQADFAIYGQLRQGLNDEISANVMREYPGAWGWTLSMDDLSGLEVSNEVAYTVTKGVKHLFEFAAQTYFPFLSANATAIAQNTKQVSLKFLKGTVLHEQPVFKYQLKCLEVLQTSYNNLSPTDRKLIDSDIDSAFVRTLNRAKL